jgi:hypothetical protein
LSRKDEPSSPVTTRIARILNHPGFTRNNNMHDVSLLFLQEPLSKTEYIHHICVPSAFVDRTSLYGKVGTIIGWGVTNQLSNDQNILRQASVPIWTAQECSSAFSSYNINDNFICAGYKEGMYNNEPFQIDKKKNTNKHSGNICVGYFQNGLKPFSCYVKIMSQM